MFVANICTEGTFHLGSLHKVQLFKNCHPFIRKVQAWIFPHKHQLENHNSRWASEYHNKNILKGNKRGKTGAAEITWFKGKLSPLPQVPQQQLQWSCSRMVLGSSTRVRSHPQLLLCGCPKCFPPASLPLHWLCLAIETYCVLGPMVAQERWHKSLALAYSQESSLHFLQPAQDCALVLFSPGHPFYFV